MTETKMLLCASLNERRGRGVILTARPLHPH